MKKILVQLPIGTHSPNLELTVSFAHELIEEGNDVTILSCSGAGEACTYNPLGLTGSCRICKKRINFSLACLTGKFQHVETIRFVDEEKQYEYASLEELKLVRAGEINIGYSALSSYVSLTRNADIDIGKPKTKFVIDGFLRTAENLYHTAQTLLLENGYDQVFLFNSRLNTYRSLLETALYIGVSVSVLEFSFDRKTARFYERAMPHSLSYNKKLMEEYFGIIDPDDAKAIADDFYRKRIEPKVSDVESYTKDQAVGLLPKDWSSSTANIAIFNSSEDELLAIGREWEEGKLFQTQLEGLTYLSELAKSTNLKFYLRIHPNQRGTSKSYLDKLHALQHERFHVISPESPVSTYALMQKCEKTVTFGSTTGAEAAYWGKPSILLGNCFYKHLNITYNPNTKEELNKLLVEKLPPKDKDGCYKFACYALMPGVPIAGYEFSDGQATFLGARIPNFKSARRSWEALRTRRFLKSIC